MPWESNQLSRTLIIERLGSPGKRSYAIHPNCRITTKEGATYLEPLPMDLLCGAMREVKFDLIEFVDPPGTARDANAGDLQLNRNAAAVTRTSPTA